MSQSGEMTGESRWEMSQSGETSGALSPGDVLSLCFAVPLASSRTCRGLTKAVLCRSQPGQGRWQAFAAKCVDLTEATLRCCSQAKQLTPPLSSLPWVRAPALSLCLPLSSSLPLSPPPPLPL
eukprot:2411237-Rhodomonas_salina.1